ncbi:MAG TPA: endolytic transglycosylase MltG [Pseudolabrys sp.]|nr:endolytic transglycosylase MltG [Pseudolabrys sp.]
MRSPRAALQPEIVPPPSLRRSKRARHPLVVAGSAFFTFLVVVLVAFVITLYVGRQRFEAAGPLATDKVVNVPRGLGTKDISDLLVREGVIDQPYVFVGGVIALKARGDLKSGEYKFAAHSSIADVVGTLIEGKVVQHAITVPEGLTSEQIVMRLQENDALAGPIKEIPREGTLLPETYKFTRGMTREQIIQRMESEDKKTVQDVWAHRDPDLPLKTPEELVTLASIVEKETGRADERTRVAAVFVNRLKRKMRLQSDPTIIYGLTGGKGTLGHPILKSEKEQPTPYNTYVIDGLPPGPIGNPGRASLEAAAKPARTKELYFVADGTGGHVFSESYEQHQKNVAKLRQIEQGAAAQAAPAADPAPAQAEAAPATGPKIIPAPRGRAPQRR